ncbi:MAG: O-antigen ligase family protein, partial [Candidatus Omnitrophica bacterium]|nr:O-antigen ligase family protein [Candidatus Omnitrophota bacterium]
FGGSEISSFLFIRVLTIGAFSLALMKFCFFRENLVSPSDWRIIRIPFFIFLAFIFYTFAQTWGGVEAVWLKKGLGSIQPFSTQRQSLQLLYYTAIFLLILDFLSSRNRMRLLVFLMGLQVALLVLWGYAQNLPGLERVPLLEKLYVFYSNPSFPAPFSTFLDSNHYGCYLMLTIPLFLGGVAYCYETAGPRLRSDLYLLENIFYILLIPLILASTYLADARAAFLAQIFFIAAFAWLGFSGRGRFKAVLTLVFLAAALFFLIRWFKPEILEQTFGQLPQSASHRLEIYQLFAQMAADYPVFGVGLGGFRWLERIYQTMNPEGAYFPHPNSDHLELLIEGGWVGYALAVGAIALLVGLALTHKRSAEDSRWCRVVRAASLVAVFAMFFLTLVEDYLETPPIAMLFILQLALLVKSGTWQSQPKAVTPGSFWDSPAMMFVRIGGTAVFMVAAIFFVKSAIGDFMVQRVILENRNTIRYVNRYSYEVIPQVKRNVSELLRAARLQPKNPKVWALLGDAYYEEALRQFGPAGRELENRSIQAYERAVRLAPTWAEAWISLGEAKFLSGMAIAGIEDIEKGVGFVPTNRDFHVYLIITCLNASQYTLSPAAARVFKDKAMTWMKKAVALPYPLTPDDMDYRNPSIGGARLSPEDKARMLALYQEVFPGGSNHKTGA